MFCTNCGAQNPDNALHCAKCGSELRGGPAPAPTSAPRTSPKAIWSLVLGILGLVCFSILTGIPAIVLGILALKDIRRDPARLAGSGLAIAGIVVGALSTVTVFLLAAIAVPNFLEAQVRSKVSRVKADLRMLATGLESYRVDNNSYPVGTTPGGGLEKLTTPVAHISSLPPDTFAREKGAPLRYHTDGAGWILVSRGPDLDYDIEPRSDYSTQNAKSSDVLWAKTYDPTNGTVSNGDIWRSPGFAP
ncbi:MAG: DUF4190 domain-containing protein [bacterium]